MTAKLSFIGAADTVTGSRTLVTCRGKTWMIDCGLFQGPKALRDRNWHPFEPAPSSLDGIILTHAHLDHSGYLPRICRQGFRGKIIATQGTTDLCRVLLRDAAKLELESANYANKTKYSHHVPALPLFTEDDVDLALAKFESLPRRHWLDLGNGVSVRFLRAGHIIGASLVQLAVETPKGPTLVTFSGDLGNDRSYVVRAPEPLMESDVLVIESTYGDRLQPRTSGLDELATIVRKTAERGGVLVIPAFAVGRAQEVTYMLRLLEDQKQIPRVPVILDSPMAASAMEICIRHPEDQALDSAFHGSDEPFRPHLFDVATSTDESMMACMRDGPLIVISASGMLNGGRVLHHLRRRLPDPKNAVLFTGFQAEGTKGRFLQEDAGKVGNIRIFHQEIPVEAEIYTSHHLSSHADQADILDYIERMRRLPTRVFVNHGTPASQTALADKIKARFGMEVHPVHSMMEAPLW